MSEPSATFDPESLESVSSAHELPLPWLDDPIPARWPPALTIELKQAPPILFGLGRQRPTWPPDNYPYRPTVTMARPPTVGQAEETRLEYGILHYFEILSQGYPSDELGYPGDIYVDLTPEQHCLYYRDRTQWRHYSAPTIRHATPRLPFFQRLHC